ncbi:MAG TPA: peptidoglycan bridge formation glycyltransferase FemA/FemB family protein [Syntrophomonadaceae bacterium]|nr:peptidoglycan bridge formation glycyltransferase FemA/FemB family protein [Syntrophomonadaceae bacterium]HRX22121.1 peptidoglycan bridge formation glycyltransferase FemA/FemB family protein [Syntrophomonadaceae bacterium]
MYTTRILDINEKAYYNQFVSKHSQGHFLQLWEWGMVKAGMGWEPLPLVVEKDGTIQASMLILKRRLPIPGIKKSIFYAPRGPVVDLEDEELCQVLISSTRRIAKNHGAIFLKIDPAVKVDNHRFRQILANCGFKLNETGLDFEGVQPKFVFRLDITPSEIALLSNMHQKWRYNIKLAGRKGVVIREAQNKEDLKIFYTILQETAKRDHFLVRDYQYFEWIWDYMVSQNYAQIFLAEYEGRVISATLGLILGTKFWYLYGASSNEDRNVMPNYLIQWEMIKWARKQGCTLYDFRGVSGDMDENNPLYGLYRFKKGFGGELTEFMGEMDKVYSPFFYLLWNKVLPLYQKISRSIKK